MLKCSGALIPPCSCPQVPDELLIERVVGRRLDPDTGAIYHLKYKPPPADVAGRLIQRSDDTEDKVRQGQGQAHARDWRSRRPAVPGVRLPSWAACWGAGSAE